MELRDRLARLGYFRSTAPPAEQAAPRAPARTASREISELLRGRFHGSCFVAEARYPHDHRHAATPIAELLNQSGDAYALLTGDERLRLLDLRRTVLVDCETTGLSGGTGTYVFLIGLGYFDEGGFRIDQFFMRDPSEERAVLVALGHILGDFEAVITFNGKCFDWPLIENRHAFARVPLQPASPLHVDLLFPARRLYRRRLPACTLGDIERLVLRMPPREGDVPGFLIPQLYFDYLRYRDGRPLVPVFEHNRADILTMLALAVRMARHAADPEKEPPDHPLDVFSLGVLLENAGLLEQALPCYERSLFDIPDPEAAHTRIAGIYKRLRETDRAVRIWQSLVDGGARTIHPYVELAKHYEHRARQPAAALALTRRAMALHGATREFTSPGRYATEREDLDRRLVRLRRKELALI